MNNMINGGPYNVKRSNSNIVTSFYSITENAKNPDTVLFRLTLNKAELKKLLKPGA